MWGASVKKDKMNERGGNMHASVHLRRLDCTMTATRSCCHRLIGERNLAVVEALRKSAHQCQVYSQPVDDCDASSLLIHFLHHD